MNTRTWHHDKDKTDWGDGPWQDEPDKVQWVDPPTGLDCIAVRNRFGNWCGYVGVPESHPLHGVGYDDCPYIPVHGGLTFSGACNEPTIEQWAEAHDLRHDDGSLCLNKDEATKLASGEVPGYLIWKEQEMGSRICHVPRESVGEVWWFGFDCAHAGDFSPGMHLPSDGTYRELTYVRNEVTKLAAQLDRIVA